MTYCNENIPDWLKPHMRLFCECGAPIADDGPIDVYGNMALTQRWCMNPQCPYHMARKIMMLAERFNVEGVGEKTAEDMAIGYRFKNHLQALDFWFDKKPEVYLYEVAQMAYIYGMDKGWKELLAGYRSFDEFFREVPNRPWLVDKNEQYLRECEQYFTIRKDVLSRRVIKVMLTGSIRGFNSRADFLMGINEKYKDYFRVEDNKKTIRDTVCLIKEPESVDYSKTDIAKNAGIPVLTSAEFITVLEQLKGEFENED